MLSAIFFDFSETLVHGTLDIDACRGSAVNLLCSSGHHVTRLQYDLAMEQTLLMKRAAKLQGIETRFEKVEREVLSKLGINPSAQLISEIEDLEFSQYKWHLLPKVRETLSELSNEFRLGIISNSASDSVIRVLEKENITLFFYAVVLSKDVGFRKPDPRIFNYALARLDVAAEETVYVGDNFVQDVLGAKKSGMKTIWLTKNYDSRSSDFDGVANSISEVPEIVAALQEMEARVPSITQRCNIAKNIDGRRRGICSF